MARDRAGPLRRRRRAGQMRSRGWQGWAGRIGARAPDEAAVSTVSQARRRFSHAELHKVIELHHRFRSGRSGGVRALLAFADLSGLAMAGCNLSEADLSGASLRGANLSECNLDRVTLFGADLRDADLEGATLIAANLRGPCLRAPNFTPPNLFKADLRDGSISRADIGGNLPMMST